MDGVELMTPKHVGWIPPQTSEQFMNQLEEYVNDPDTQAINMTSQKLWEEKTIPIVIFEILRRAFTNGESFALVMGELLRELRLREVGTSLTLEANKEHDWFFNCCLDIIGSPIKTIDEAVKKVKG